MVTGLPRSATTWAATWLDAERTTCVHDPLYRWHYEDWDEALGDAGRIAGASCTGIWRWPGWLNAHPARVLVLRRPLAEVNASMAAIGLPALSRADEAALDLVEGLHVPHADLFDPDRAERIWGYLTGGAAPFDPARHGRLARVMMEPDMPRVLAEADPRLNRRLAEELGSR